MAREAQLPLEGLTSDGEAVTIGERGLGVLTQLAGWDRFEEVADAALGRNALSTPKDYRQPVRTERETVWRTAPDRVLVASEAPLALESSDELAVLDLSDARICLVLEGAGAADLLGRVMAIDFSEDSFPAGAFVQGALHHVGVLVDRRANDRFEVLIPITWATSLISLLTSHLRLTR